MDACNNFECVGCSQRFGCFGLNLSFVSVDWKQTMQTVKVKYTWKRTTVATSAENNTDTKTKRYLPKCVVLHKLGFGDVS